MVCFQLFYGSNDSRSVGRSNRSWFDRLIHVELDVTGLKVMVIDFDRAADSGVLGVHEPLRLPLAAPVSREVKVDARNVDLELTLLVEAQTGPSCALLEYSVNVAVNSLCNSRP